MATKQIFMIRIVYKSGYTHDFETYNFKIEDGRYSWEPVSIDNHPLLLGADEVAAVWQVGVRDEILPDQEPVV